MSEGFVCMAVVHGCVLPVGAREGTGFPGTAIEEDWEPLMWALGTSSPCPLQESRKCSELLSQLSSPHLQAFVILLSGMFTV